ncbi:MAG: sulfite exporter TauE/SafE family protein [Gemmatimonadaceae bacterium]|nr:sulfite exporter TauE/SafE family protein [Gemmatimonadaceae bacterium]
MTALLVAIFVASLVGSAHCAAMCGSFACLANGRASGWYHAGRLVSYLTLGVIAGAMGGLVNLGGAWVGVQRAATIVASLLIVVWGVVMLAEQRGVRVPLPSVATPAQRWLGGALHALRDRPPALRGAALGLLTTLIPCGWLYAFVVSAAGTGRVVSAGAVMLAFWAGTVPALATLGLGATRLSAPLRARLPQLSAVALVTVGLLSLAWRALPSAHDHAVPSVPVATGSPTPDAVDGHHHH